MVCGVCALWLRLYCMDDGDSEYAAVELVVVKVRAVTGGVVAVYVVRRVKTRAVSAIFLTSTMSETCRSALQWELTWCVRWRWGRSSVVTDVARSHGVPVLTDDRIDLEPGSQPTTHRIYRMSPPEEKEVKIQFEVYLSTVQIDPARSPFGAGVLFAKQKDRTQRFCNDYSALIKMTQKDKYIIPMSDETLDGMVGLQLFSKIDLAQGYQKIRGHHEHVHNTAFQNMLGSFNVHVLSTRNRFLWISRQRRWNSITTGKAGSIAKVTNSAKRKKRLSLSRSLWFLPTIFITVRNHCSTIDQQHVQKERKLELESYTNQLSRDLKTSCFFATPWSTTISMHRISYMSTLVQKPWVPPCTKKTAPAVFAFSVVPMNETSVQLSVTTSVTNVRCLQLCIHWRSGNTTNNIALNFWRTAQIISPRHVRKQPYISMLEIDISHIHGVANTAADAIPVSTAELQSPIHRRLITLETQPFKFN